MASDAATCGVGDQFRLDRAAHVHHIWTACVKRTAGRRVRRGGYITGQDDTLAFGPRERFRDRRDQRLGVRVLR